MTASLGGAARSPGIEHATAPGTLLKGRVGSHTPAILIENTVALTEPSHLMQYTHADRQLGFQYLVRRFFLQIRYGCQEKYCTTPTCFSCQKRVRTAPIRRPTALTARALAFFLASQDNPASALCPHKPIILPTELDYPSSRLRTRSKDQSGRPGNGSGAQSRSDANVHSDSASGDPKTHSEVDSTPKGLNIRQNGDGKGVESVADASDSKELHPEVQKFQTWNKHRSQAKKDRKSPAQNLFDTISVRFFEWSPIPSPSTFLSRPPREPGPSPSPAEPPSDIQVADTQGRPSAENSVAETTSVGSEQDSQPSVKSPSSSSSPSPKGFTILPNSPSAIPRLNGLGGTKEAEVLRISSGLARDEKMTGVPRSLPSSVKPRSLRHPPKDKSIGRLDSAESCTKLVFGKDEHVKHAPPQQLKDQSSTHVVDVNLRERISPQKPPRDPHAPSPLKPLDDFERFRTLASSHLSCKIMEGMREVARDRNMRGPPGPEPLGLSVFPGYLKSRSSPALLYIDQSLFHCLSSPDILLRSFRDKDSNETLASPLSYLDPVHMEVAFRGWTNVNGSLIFDSLWHSLEALFAPPSEIVIQKSPRLRAARKYSSDDLGYFVAGGVNHAESSAPEYLDDLDIAHIVMISIHALTSLIPKGRPSTWAMVRRLRSFGVLLPITNNPQRPNQQDSYHRPWLHIVDELEYEPAFRLATRLVRGIAARKCFYEIQGVMSGRKGKGRGHDSPASNRRSPLYPLMELLLGHLEAVENDPRKWPLDFDGRNSPGRPKTDPGWSVTSIFLEWLRSIILKEWNGEAEVKRWSAVGGAIEILAALWEKRSVLRLPDDMFAIPFLSERMDPVEAAAEFANRISNPNMLHLLSYPFLFPQPTVVSYFRSLNYLNMLKAYEDSGCTVHLWRHLSQMLGPEDPRQTYLKRQLRPQLGQYLVLDVRRESPLEDAFDQLWRIERRELLKPLKVRMGAMEGELGLDHGGVSLEFFQVALREAFNPDNGLFTIDPRTRMTWFQPLSVEASSRVELIGVLFSLAVYNGITLPVTFPLAFYAKLLGWPVRSVDDIRDGWPTLAKSFDELLKWDDGDVADVFVREYVFSFEWYGQNIDVDMKAIRRHDRWPHDPSSENAEDFTSATGSRDGMGSSPNDWLLQADGDPEKEPELVTNENRKEFVRDYIHWLTQKSVENALDRFCKGFFACLDRTALRLLDPPLLRSLLEGHPDIDTHGLEHVTRYEDGYTPSTPIVREFWNTVHTFSSTRKRQLLEFVTASDRIPVNGVQSVVFCVVRAGGDSEMLPTSMTCFGKLMLPEYKDGAKLRQKLSVALENSRGFGSM